MIDARPGQRTASAFASLVVRARRIAEARAEDRHLARSGRLARRWRKAALLWPLFAKG